MTNSGNPKSRDCGSFDIWIIAGEPVLLCSDLWCLSRPWGRRSFQGPAWKARWEEDGAIPSRKPADFRLDADHKSPSPTPRAQPLPLGDA